MKRNISLAVLAILLLLSCACGGEDNADNTDGDDVADGDIENSDGEDNSDGDMDSNLDGDMEVVEGDSDTETEADAEEQPERRLVDYVNPFMGTGGRGFMIGSSTPAATAPFGMVKVGPDTTGVNGAPPFYHCSGYFYEDPIIIGFSHTHMHGTGVPDYGHIMFQPLVGFDESSTNPKNYKRYFAKEDEFASPGYYAVKLDNGVNVELTAREHSAHHRYAYPAETGENAYVLIDLTHAAEKDYIKDSEITVDAEKREVSGWVFSHGSFSGRFGGHYIYFAARFKQDFATWGTWKDWDLYPNEITQRGEVAGAYFSFASEATVPVEAQVGISFISIEQAKLNLETEMTDWDFDAARLETENYWETELSRIDARSTDEESLKIFYSSLYHAFQMPTLFTDVNGKYLGFDDQVHEADGFRYYTDFSLWDTYRTLHPLLILVQPERQLDMVKSLIKMYEQGGGFPKWPMANGYSNCMVGTSSDIVVSETYIKGITDFDAETAYEGLCKTANAPPPEGAEYSGRGNEVASYLELGYVAADQGSSSVSKSQEYYYDDWALSHFAEALGKTEDAAMFLERSMKYPLLWHPDTKFFRARNLDGSWVEEFSEVNWLDYYTEGTAWQYLWFVPQDIPGLMELFGGRDAMFERLDKFFEEEKARQQRIDEGSILDQMGTPQYYWHGNEPDLHASYIYADAGKPSKTQEWARWIMATLYGLDSEGLQGNDDCGTMAAWYIFTSMGFYPVPGSVDYIVGSPALDSVSILDKDGQAVLTINAANASRENVYVQSAELNGEDINAVRLNHTQITGGAVLDFVMGPEPSSWGETAE